MFFILDETNFTASSLVHLRYYCLVEVSCKLLDAYNNNYAKVIFVSCIFLMQAVIHGLFIPYRWYSLTLWPMHAFSIQWHVVLGHLFAFGTPRAAVFINLYVIFLSFKVKKNWFYLNTSANRRGRHRL